MKDATRTCLWKLPALGIFFLDNARKTPDPTSNVGSSCFSNRSNFAISSLRIMLIIKSNRTEIREYKLAHIQFRSNLLPTTELHHQVLVTSLALSDRPSLRTEVSKETECRDAERIMKIIRRSSFGRRNNLDMLEYTIL